MNGELALPTISTPPGAMVKLSGCDFASPIRMSEAEAAWTKLRAKATDSAKRRRLELDFGLDIVNLLGTELLSASYRCRVKAGLNHDFELHCHIGSWQIPVFRGGSVRSTS